MNDKEIVNRAMNISKAQNKRMYEIFEWVKYLLITKLNLSVSTVYPREGAGVYIYGSTPVRILGRLNNDVMTISIENIESIDSLESVMVMVIATVISKAKNDNIVALLVDHGGNERLITILENNRLVAYDDSRHMLVVSNHEY